MAATPKRNKCARPTLLLTTLIIATCTTSALPVSEIPDLRHHYNTRPTSSTNNNINQYATSDISHVSEQPDTRDVSSPHALKRYKSSHHRREIDARDLKQARTQSQSRKEHQTSREPQPSNTNSWFNSFSKLFGITVNEQNNDIDNDTALDTTRHNIHNPSQPRITHQQHQQYPQRFELDPHHPADFGSDEEIQTSLLEPETALESESRATILDDDDKLISKTDLQDLVRLFRRMFTTLEHELNQTKEATEQSAPPCSANNDLNSVLEQAQELNRRKQLERKKALVQTGDEEVEHEEEDADADHDDRPELPVGSPAYESRKRIMRGLNSMVERERPGRRAVTWRPTRVRADDREHLSQAMSAGLLPYL